jgi:hypothetical protein
MKPTLQRSRESDLKELTPLLSLEKPGLLMKDQRVLSTVS